MQMQNAEIFQDIQTKVEFNTGVHYYQIQFSFTKIFSILSTQF